MENVEDQLGKLWSIRLITKGECQPGIYDVRYVIAQGGVR